jgi:uncharacterized protein (TIGR03083 family)
VSHRLNHRDAMALAAEEHRRFGDLLEDLDEHEWSLTVKDCPDWDVRQLVSHVVGGMVANASMRANLSQLRRSRRYPGELPDAISALQVEERSGMSPGELLAQYRELIPKAVAGRRRIPTPVRSLVRIPAGGWWGKEWMSLGYLTEVIYTRDTWMHRVDVSRATDRPLHLTADHDGRLVDDVVADWASRHGSPYTLTLTGPAGGTWSSGDGGEDIEMDAVEFCRTVAAREPGTGLLSEGVPF